MLEKKEVCTNIWRESEGGSLVKDLNLEGSATEKTIITVLQVKRRIFEGICVLSIQNSKGWQIIPHEGQRRERL